MGMEQLTVANDHFAAKSASAKVTNSGNEIYIDFTHIMVYAMCATRVRLG